MHYGPFRVFSVSWPVGLVALPFGAVYWLLLCVFSDSIDASVKMRAYIYSSRWGGIEILFTLNSAILSWISVVVAEHRTGISGFVILLMVLPWCFSSIGGGFALASLYVETFSDAVWEMLAYSLVSAVGVSVFRTYWGNIH